MVIEWTQHGKPSLVGLVTGTIAGLATITPGSGFVGPVGGLVTSEAGGTPTLSALFEEALQEKLKKLRRRHNGGRRFRRRKANLLAGRPPRRP